MYRVLLLFPKSAGGEQVDPVIESIATSFKSRSDNANITRSVGSLMGPGAHAGTAGWILEADFPSLEAALAALDSDDFKEVKERAEQLTSDIFLFEIGEI